MKRSLMLVVLTLVVLAVPTTASACTWVCEGIFGPCVYDRSTYSYCEDQAGGVCEMHYCRSNTAANRTAMLSTRWQIASIEIERRDPADTRDSAVRVAAANPEPAKIETQK